MSKHGSLYDSGYELVGPGVYVKPRAYRMMLRFDAFDEIHPLRISSLNRKIRELAERELGDVDTNYGFVVDVIEPR